MQTRDAEKSWTAASFPCGNLTRWKNPGIWHIFWGGGVWDAETGVHQHTIKSEVQGLGLSFSEDGRYVKTTQGSYTLSSGALAPSSDADLYRDPLWVRRGDQRLLYLLPEYRGWSATLGPNAVAFAGASGQVIFLDLI